MTLGKGDLMFEEEDRIENGEPGWLTKHFCISGLPELGFNFPNIATEASTWGYWIKS